MFRVPDVCCRWLRCQGHPRGGVGCVTEQTQQPEAHLHLWCMQNYTGGTQILPFPKFDWYWSMHAVQNELDFCRGEMMLLVVPHVSILFRNPILAAKQT